MVDTKADATSSSPDEQSDGARRVASARRLLALGAVVTVAGVALGGTVARDAGGIVALLGWALFVFGVHSFGRLGPD